MPTPVTAGPGQPHDPVAAFLYSMPVLLSCRSLSLTCETLDLCLTGPEREHGDQILPWLALLGFFGDVERYEERPQSWRMDTAGEHQCHSSGTELSWAGQGGLDADPQVQ